MASPSNPVRPRALLTGHDGFTGRYVARELEAAGYEVFGLSRAAGEGQAAVLNADLMDGEALGKVVDAVGADVVVHLAAIAFVAHGNVDSIYQVNVLGTRHLLEALAAASTTPRLVVLASSANIYGNAGGTAIAEDVNPAPANDYAVSKLAMEHMARLWADRLPIVMTRPFNYTGVGQSTSFLIPKIVDHFRRGASDIELGNIRVWRDFSDVRSIAKAYVDLVEKAEPGSVFNLCSGRGHSLEEVLDLMGEIAGYRIRVRVNPGFVRANEVQRLVGDGQRLAAVTDALPGIPFPETLRWMYSSADPDIQR